MMDVTKRVPSWVIFAPKSSYNNSQNMRFDHIPYKMQPLAHVRDAPGQEHFENYLYLACTCVGFHAAG